MCNERTVKQMQRALGISVRPRHGRAAPRRPAGFTILELMVVSVVIVVLAAMILPVLASARESARKTQCRNNMAQLGKAIILYSKDYQELMPAVLPAPGESTAELYDENGKNGLGILFPGYNRDPRLFFCPGANHYTPKEFDNWGRGVVVSSFYYRGTVDGTESLLVEGKKAMLMDNNRQASIGRHNHGGRFTNLLFMDGHVVGVGDPEQKSAQTKAVDVWAWADLQ